MHFDKKMSGISPKNHKQGINFPLLSQTYVTGSGLQGLGSTSLPKLKSSTPPLPAFNFTITLQLLNCSSQPSGHVTTLQKPCQLGSSKAD